jgi:putative NADH-flavin reductase
VNILVFGAGGATGRLVVEEALAAGHRVTAFVRAASASIPDRARVIVGDATDMATVRGAMPGHDTVVSTLGVRNALRSGRLIERSMAEIVPAMQLAEATRLVVMSALGVGATFAQAPRVPRILYRVMLGDIFGDKERGERLVEASPLDWTIVHPPLLTDGPLTGAYRAGETVALSGFPKISRANVAHFLVETLDSEAWSRKHVIVTG